MQLLSRVKWRNGQGLADSLTECVRKSQHHNNAESGNQWSSDLVSFSRMLYLGSSRTRRNAGERAQANTNSATIPVMTISANCNNITQ